ncbi:MAG: glycosyltransferase [Clostridia bacterium]
MRILYISPSLPNDFSRIRTKNILKSLINKGHSITYLSLIQSKDKNIFDEQLVNKFDHIYTFKQNKITSIFNCLIGIFMPIPLQTAYVNNKKMHKYLKENSEEYDLIYIKRLRMAQYAKYFDKNKVLIDITDSLTKYYKRVYKKTNGIKKILNIEEYLKHKIYEKRIVEKYKSVVCSNDEKKYIINKFKLKSNKINVVENLIDFNLWDVKKEMKGKEKRKQLVFSGILDYEPNIMAVNYFANNVIDILGDDYKLNVVGKNYSNSLVRKNKIKYIGYVDNMANELSKYDIYICPIIAGSGTKNKILQAMSVGLPIVSTTLGTEGLHDECKNFIFYANKPEEFIKAIKEINKLSNNELKTLIVNQKNTIKKNYDYSIAETKIMDIIR